jgi:hypothetical protein
MAIGTPAGEMSAAPFQRVSIAVKALPSSIPKLRNCNLVAQISTRAFDLAVTTAVLQVQLALPLIEDTKIRTSLDEFSFAADGINRLSTSAERE